MRCDGVAVVVVVVVVAIVAVAAVVETDATGTRQKATAK